MGTLKLGEHAESRAYSRQISTDTILKVVQKGKRWPTDGRVLHYDREMHIGVVVDWRSMVIVTVIHLSDRHCGKLRAWEKAQPEALKVRR